jgi:hypothetical protein
MKIVFETEYEKLCFERLLKSIYDDTASFKKDTPDTLADSLASLFVKVSKADTLVEKSDYTKTITTLNSISLPALPYPEKNPPA